MKRILRRGCLLHIPRQQIQDVDKERKARAAVLDSMWGIFRSSRLYAIS